MGGSSSPPPAPNPNQVSQTQGQMNVDAAIAQSQLNNVNQVTPYGTITYDQIGTVMGPHGQQMPRFQATTQLSPKMRDLYRSNIANAQSTSALEMALLGNAQGTLSQPLDLGWSETEARLNELGRNTLDPQYAQYEAELNQKLQNQGLTPGSDGWKYAQLQFAQNRASAYNDLYLRGHQQAVSDAMNEYSSPLNTLTALRGNTQVSQPGIGQLAPTAQSQIQPPDYQGVVSNNYNAAMQAYGMQQMQQNQMMGGMFGLGGSLLQALPFLKLSDEDDKTDLVKLGEKDGVPIYSFRYKGEPKNKPKTVGPLAQDLEEKDPGSTMNVAGHKVIKPAAAKKWGLG